MGKRSDLFLESVWIDLESVSSALEELDATEEIREIIGSKIHLINTALNYIQRRIYDRMMDA